jgi:hypothetical protein
MKDQVADNYWNYSTFGGNHWVTYDSEEEGCYDTDTDGFIQAKVQRYTIVPIALNAQI